jgi:polyphosphate kinase
MRAKLRNKEISWLSFNARVLQEVADPEVPLLERIRFLGIFSSNLDEFYCVRVATLRRLSDMGTEAKKIIGHDPRKILKHIQKTVLELTEQLNRNYEQILNDLAKHHIYMINEQHLSEKQSEFVKNFFRKDVRSKLIPIMLDGIETFPAMRFQSIYLAIRLTAKNNSLPVKHALIEIPTDWFSRFLILPGSRHTTYVMFLDDVIRHSLSEVFSIFHYDRFEAFTVKLTRDAELDVDDDLSQSFIKKMARSIKQRKEGSPVRFIYDAQMPRPFLDLFIHNLHLDTSDTLIPGSRYHNFKDFMQFPNFRIKDWEYPDIQSLSHPLLETGQSVMKAIQKQDILLHYPYHSFNYFIDLLREASIDPEVKSIRITLYRVAKYSSVINALINAVKNGKSVTVILELQARFDEEANIHWANKMQEEGVRVIYGVPGLKVHSKLLLITRKSSEGNGKQLYAAIGTGNFNEDTAGIYSDHTLFTADRRLTREVDNIFSFFETNYNVTPFKHLIVSPFNMRKKLMKLIKTAINTARTGEKAEIILKCNNLVDEGIVRQLYKASEAGVPIKLIVRGMFSPVPGIEGMSENIRAISIVDRYLEHSRIFAFRISDAWKVYLTSGDLMFRNLDRRVEVTCPIYDHALKQELLTFLELQWKDNTRARTLDENLRNKYRRSSEPKPFRFQFDFYPVLQDLTGRRLIRQSPNDNDRTG